MILPKHGDTVEMTPGRIRVLEAFRAMASDDGYVTMQAIADRLCLCKTTVYEHLQYLIQADEVVAKAINDGPCKPKRRYRLACSGRGVFGDTPLEKFIYRPVVTND